LTGGRSFGSEKIDGGDAFFERCSAALRAAGRAYVVVRGTWEDRARAAGQAVAAMVAG